MPNVSSGFLVSGLADEVRRKERLNIGVAASATPFGDKHRVFDKSLIKYSFPNVGFFRRRFCGEP
jgi:hypothetical protein